MKVEHTVKNIIVIGAGLHFRERYYPVLCKAAADSQLRIMLVIDLLPEKERICGFFSGKEVSPEHYLFLQEKYRHYIHNNELDDLLPENFEIENIDGVLICTEPKAHKIYALWAIRKGLHVFCDKPLTAFSDLSEAESLLGDFHEISDELSRRQVNFVLSCERRAHAGYDYVKTYLTELITRFRVPVTFIDIHFGGGMWNMPDEFFFRENHPYKYGYGVLLHSGYHYIDLLFDLMSVNKLLYPDLGCAELKATAIRPADQLGIIGNTHYEQLLGTDRFMPYFDRYNVDMMKEFGETDIMIMGSFKSGDKTASLYNLKLMETSVSGRSWHKLPENTYINNGRMRQERVTIHVGPLCTIHVSSHSFAKQKTADNIEHFSIEIINNTRVTGYETHIKIDRKDLSRIYPDLPLHSGMNVLARQWQLKDYLQGGNGRSPLTSHLEPVWFISEVYSRLKVYGHEIAG